MNKVTWLVITLTIALGLATIGLAQLYEDTKWLNAIVLSLGVAILGVGVTLLIIEPLGIGVLATLQRYITKLDMNPLVAGDRELNPFRIIWHNYRLTENSNGEWRWIYTRFDMRDADPHGWLAFEHGLTDGIVKPSEYVGHCFLVRNCLIVVHKSKLQPSEDYTEIYPLADRPFLDRIPGMAILETYRNTRCWTRTLICREPIEHSKTNGDRSHTNLHALDANDSKTLDGIWHEQSRVSYSLFPCDLQHGTSSDLVNSQANHKSSPSPA
jgi:hypothetical protein